MIAILLAALQIVWSGAGFLHATREVPVIVTNPPSARVPLPGATLLAQWGGRFVDAEWSVRPQGAIDLDAATLTAGGYRGPLQFTARYGGASASLPGYAYASASVGCYIGSVDGLRFDDDGVAHASGTRRESDIYVTGPANAPRMDIFRGCLGAFVAPPPETLHAPYGAVVFPRSLNVYFGFLRAASFRAYATRMPVPHAGAIILFRTRNGRTVKMLNWEPAPGVLGGAYLAAQPGREFADYAYYTRHAYVPHAIFGPHHA